MKQVTAIKIIGSFLSLIPIRPYYFYPISISWDGPFKHNDTHIRIRKDGKYAEVGKVTLKSNGDEALSDESLLKSNGNEALNDNFS